MERIIPSIWFRASDPCYRSESPGRNWGIQGNKETVDESLRKEIRKESMDRRIWRCSVVVLPYILFYRLIHKISILLNSTSSNMPVGAPTSQEVLHFLKWVENGETSNVIRECFKCTISNGYGGEKRISSYLTPTATETGSIQSGGQINLEDGVSKFMQVRAQSKRFNIESLMSQNWTILQLIDLIQGVNLSSRPKLWLSVIGTTTSWSELCPELTCSIYSQWGVFHIGRLLQNWWSISAVHDLTKPGDIVELNGPNQVKIIDRKKAFFKLAQGEFVAWVRIVHSYDWANVVPRSWRSFTSAAHISSRYGSLGTCYNLT